MEWNSFNAYKERYMNIESGQFPDELEEPCPNPESGRAINPRHVMILALVLVVGAASAVAVWFADFSLRDRAARGDAEAQYRLGKRYFDNALSPRDYVCAANLIRKAADQGYARAQTGLGLLYEKGFGVPQDYSEAVRWLRRAADQGYSVAQNELGVMYAKGHGVPRNLGEASKWCQLAAVQGSEIAKRNFALAEIGAARVIPVLRTPGKKSYSRAVVQKIEVDGVTISFQPARGGIGLAKLNPDSLPSELKELCKYAAKQGTVSGSAYTQIGSVATRL